MVLALVLGRTEGLPCEGQRLEVMPVESGNRRTNGQTVRIGSRERMSPGGSCLQKGARWP